MIEICPLAGWICELVRTLGIEIQVASTAHDAWRWKNVKRKNDRQDALKLAQLSVMNQLTLVHVPERAVRQWRLLIQFRQRLVGRRTKIKNHIRDLLSRAGLSLTRGHGAWTIKGLAELEALARPLGAVGADELWRGELAIELQSLKEIAAPMRAVEQKLDELAQADKSVQLLQTIPGVGPRLAEALVTLIDNPQRFKRGKEVGAYIGMVPKQLQSGETNRLGRITRQGNRLVRSLLVEVGWIGLRYNAWIRAVYERVRRGSKARKKIAMVAVARRLLIRCWAMLRDGTPWRPAPHTV
ncbi:MAG TPA: IS110 family transposase [Gemmatimonadaceae bacterium]|nr:IS110 family transposase [Gemmatimonadaceae bacterium]